MLSVEQLQAIVGGDEFALARITTTYEPAGGDGSKLAPPTFPTDRDDPQPYLLEDRVRDGKPTGAVVLDQVPSQANRAEEALADAQRAGEIALPLLRLTVDGAVDVVLTGLDAPHRAFDAYWRDSLLGGVKFDRTEVGMALQASSPADASALLRHDPGTIVYGGWNSHRKGRQAKFPRVYASEIVGWEPMVGQRKAGRMDPLNLVGSRKGDGDDWEYSATGAKGASNKLSEIGHGNVAPPVQASVGGVTVTGVTRYATLSLAALARVRFGAMPAPAQTAARVLLAAYGLLADRLAFGGPGLWLRSGCDLVTLQESLGWVGRGGVVEEFALDRAGALRLFADATAAAQDAGVSFALEPVELTPSPALRKAIEFSLTKAESTDA